MDGRGTHRGRDEKQPMIIAAVLMGHPTPPHPDVSPTTNCKQKRVCFFYNVTVSSMIIIVVVHKQYLEYCYRGNITVIHGTSKYFLGISVF